MLEISVFNQIFSFFFWRYIVQSDNTIVTDKSNRAIIRQLVSYEFWRTCVAKVPRQYPLSVTCQFPMKPWWSIVNTVMTAGKKRVSFYYCAKVSMSAFCFFFFTASSPSLSLSIQRVCVFHGWGVFCSESLLAAKSISIFVQLAALESSAPKKQQSYGSSGTRVAGQFQARARFQLRFTHPN